MSRYKSVIVDNPSIPKQAESIRLLCFSDTHLKHNQIPCDSIYESDIAICAGDFSRAGRKETMINFKKWLMNLPVEHRVICAGNHDWTLDLQHFNDNPDKYTNAGIVTDDNPIESFREILNDKTIHYLDNEVCEVMGIKFFGSPNIITKRNIPFKVTRQQDDETYLKMHKTFGNDVIDVFVSHSPPYTILDIDKHKNRKGRKGLLHAVKMYKPVLHVFGHVHDSHGSLLVNGTLFANVAICNSSNVLTHPLTYIDLIPTSQI